jgi:ferredoxin
VKIVLDGGRCEAHGECVVAAPELFDIGEEDEAARVLDASPGEQLRKKAEFAVRLCPVAALRIDD